MCENLPAISTPIQPTRNVVSVGVATRIDYSRQINTSAQKGIEAELLGEINGEPTTDLLEVGCLSIPLFRLSAEDRGGVSRRLDCCLTQAEEAYSILRYLKEAEPKVALASNYRDLWDFVRRVKEDPRSRFFF